MSESLRFPVTLFTTKKRFNDFGAPDMRYGDLSESTLKHNLGLINISNVADPYRLVQLTPFDNPQSPFAGVYINRQPKMLTVKECASLLFDEMKRISLPFSLYGQYRHLINQMLNHMQNNTGAAFINGQLHLAYKSQILNDRNTNSTRNTIIKVFNRHASYINNAKAGTLIRELAENINSSMLPKFNAFADQFNGMGVTVHDVHATKIDLIDLEQRQNRWRARVKYTAQDHFGLDISDIQNKKFRQFQFFKIWFILQRFERFGFRPFMTNMEATIDLEGALL